MLALYPKCLHCNMEVFISFTISDWISQEVFVIEKIILNDKLVFVVLFFLEFEHRSLYCLHMLLWYYFVLFLSQYF